MDLLTILLIFTTVLFFATSCVLGYASYNNVKKIEIYEEWLEYFRGEITQVKRRLKMVDDKQLFPNDEDVGFVFSEIQRVVDEFNEKIK